MTEAASQLAISNTDIKVLGNLMPTMPQHIKNMPDAVATMIVARELGLAPLSSFPDLFIVNGNIGMTSKLMLALVLNAGHRLDVIEMTADTATLSAKRRYDGVWEEVGVFTFTQEDAERANLWVKETYQYYPADMLMNKAVARAVRFAFPDVLRGYVPDEMEDIVGLETNDSMHLDPMGQPMELDELVEVFDAELVDGE